MRTPTPVSNALRALSDRLNVHRTTTEPGCDRRLAPGFFGPVDYSRRVRYRRPPDAYLHLQWLAPILTSLGISPKYVVNLEVPGRRSGLIHRTTLVQVTDNSERYLVSLAGESQWVRNLRAADGRVVVGRKQRHAATLVEVPAQERAPIIRAYLLRAGRRAGSNAVTSEARYYFGVSANPSLEELQEVVENYPVFRIVDGARTVPGAHGPGRK